MVFGKIKQLRRITYYESQLEGLFRSDYKKMYRIAVSYTHSEQEAYDVISESFQKALSAFEHTKEISDFPAWFYSILIRTAIDHWRKEKRQPQLMALEQAPEFSLDELDHLDQLEIKQILQQLDSPGREIILLKFFEGFTLKEIAAILELNENTVKTTMYRTLTAIRKILSS